MTKLISLCMIVKDEEAVLRRCLQSVHQYVDEIVIVDTGSVDKTKEIAREFTDNIYDFNWINDFSAARNESLKYATGKWILVLDADEYMDDKDIRELRSLLENMEPDARSFYSLSIISFLGKRGSQTSNEGNVARVFPNYMGFKYIRPIHEQVTSDKTSQSSLLPIRIFHSGYEEETIAIKNKHDRNLSIFQQLKKQSGWTAYDHLMLGSQYILMLKYDVALDHFLKALRDNNQLANNNKHKLIFSIMQVYFNTAKYVDAWIFAEKHLKPYDDYPDTITLRGLILNNLGFTERAKVKFQQAVDNAENRSRNHQDLCIVSPDMATTIPMKQLVFLYEKDKNFSQMVHYLTKILITDPRDIDSLTKLIQILSLQKESKEVLVPFLNKLLRADEDPMIPLLVCKVSITLGYKLLAQAYIEKLDSPDSLPLSDRLRYTLLTNDKSSFESQWSKLGEDDKSLPNHLKYRILGALAWGERDWVNPDVLSSDHESYNFLVWTGTLLKEDFASEIVNKQNAFTFGALSELYTLQQHVIFDRIIDNVNSDELINSLANFFYTRHQESNALQYYSHLNEQGLLNTVSCVNLAFYSINQKSIEDALLFLERAISLQPNNKQLYILYYAFCQDHDKKKKIIQQLYKIDEKYKELKLL